MNGELQAEEEIDADRLVAWLTSVVDTPVSSMSVTRIAGGHSSGAWRLDIDASSLVLKAPTVPSVVHRRDACREARIVQALALQGAPLPAVVAIDHGDRAVGLPCFLMEHVAGRSLADTSPASYHDDPWLRGEEPEAQRAVWDSFHDALAALHRVDPVTVPEARLGPNGLADVLAYWRDALLDAAPADTVPRQLALLDWLGEHLPPGADDDPAVCMGDARMVNCIIEGREVRALVDFEVAYVGNPAADIGYSLFMDAQHRANSPVPLPGLPTPQATWARWSDATGRRVDDRDYWTAFGAMVVGITATRAMVQWGLAGPDVESSNPLVASWEAAVARTAR